MCIYIYRYLCYLSHTFFVPQALHKYGKLNLTNTVIGNNRNNLDDSDALLRAFATCFGSLHPCMEDVSFHHRTLLYNARCTNTTLLLQRLAQKHGNDLRVPEQLCSILSCCHDTENGNIGASIFGPTSQSLRSVTNVK